MPTYSAIDPFLDDPRIGSKLKLTPILGAAAGVDEVNHTQLVVHPFSQTKILQAVGASNFTNANLESSLLKSQAQSAAKFLALGILRPAEMFHEATTRFKEFLTELKTEGPLAGPIAYVSTQLGTLLPIEQLWQDRVITPLNNLLSTNPSATLAQIAAALGPAVTVQTDSANEKSLRFSFDASHFSGGTPSTSVSGLNLGPGAALSATGAFTFTGSLNFSGILGIDLTQGDEWGKSLFIRDLNLALGGNAAINNLNAGITLGGVTASVEGGSFSLNTSVDVALRSPTGSTQVTLDDILSSLPQITDLATLTPTAALDLRLPLNLTSSATNFSLANFGRPVVSAASSNLFAGTPDVLVDIELGPALQDQILSLMAQLDTAADSVSSQPVFNQVIPGLGKSLNGLLNSSGTTNHGWGDLIKLEQAAADYFNSFDPASLNFNPANIARKPAVVGLRKALTDKIEAATQSLFSIGSTASPISLKGGLDLANNKLEFVLSINGSFLRSINLDFSALGPQWNDIGLAIDADAQVNVNTSINALMHFGVGLSQVTGVDPFLTINNFQVNAAINGDGSTLGMTLGGGTLTGTLTATKLQVSAGAVITFANTAAPLPDRLQIAPSGALDLDLRVSASLFGTSIGSPANLPRIRVVDSNLFNATPPVFTLDMAPLTLNLSPETVISALLGLANWLDSATGSGVLATKIPLINKSVGEVLASAAELRQFDSHQILSLAAPTIVDGFKRFEAKLNIGGQTASSLGIKPDDVMTFLSTTGERFEAIVDSVEGELVKIRYPESRQDTPDLSNPGLRFKIGGSLASTLRSALEDYVKPGVIAPSLGQLLNDLAEPLGISFANIAYNETTKLLAFTPTFTPKPIQFRQRLDLGEEIPGLDFNASGDFLISAAPTIRLPLEVNLSSDSLLTPSTRVSVIDDALPEVTLALTAQLDNPQARASLGFLSVRLTEDATPNNDGLKFNSTLQLNIKDPGVGASANNRATIAELTTPANLNATFLPSISGGLEIDGLTIKPEIAGTPVPGQMDVFTTTTAGGSTRGIATFSSLNELGSIFDKVSTTNSIGSFDSITPEAIVSMFVQLGTSVQAIASELDVPDGIPFVKQAISGVINFSQTAQEFARQLYFNPKLVGAGDISVTNGRLSQDASFAMRIEGGEPVLITVLASSTTTNNTLDDLYADINQALANAGLGGKVIAERQKPFGSSQISLLVDESSIVLPGSVQPLPVGFARYRANFTPSINLFNLGLRVGDVIQYLDTSGRMQSATVDEMAISSLAFRFELAAQPRPRTGADRSLNVFDAQHVNRLALRTTSPTVGISLELSSVQITAAGDLPTQLTQDTSFTLTIDGSPVTVNVLAASTAQNGQPSDMVTSLNSALAATNFAGAGLNQKLRATLVGSRVRLVNIDSATQDLSIDGATVFGFTSGQAKDTNTARMELGLSDPGETAGSLRDGMLASPKFRAATIQDLVHVLNGLIQQQFAGAPFTAALNYLTAPTRRVEFNIALGTTFTKTIDLDFDKGLDVGFTQLSIAGDVDATLTANAGVELTVGLDLDPSGVGQTITNSTLLSSLDKGRGVPVKVGRLGASVNSSGKNSPATDLTMAFTVHRFGGITNNINVTVPAAQVADNTNLSDLARDLSQAIAAVNIPGLAPIAGIAPVEVQAVDGKLLLVANSKQINGLTIGAGTSSFLGFTAGQTSNQPDLSITLRNGTSFTVNLDFSETIGDLKNKIEAAAGGSSVLEVSFVGDKLKLQDKTAQVGANKFKIAAAGDGNGFSPIGSLLGIVAEVSPVSDDPNTPANETNAGDILIGPSLLAGPVIDQFYVKTSGSKAFANVTIAASDIDLVATLGILDLGIVNGTLSFGANASLGLLDVDNPDTTTINESTDGKLRLSDFTIAGFDDILVPAFNYSGSANLPIDGSLLTFLPAEFQAGGSSPLSIQASLSNQAGSLKPLLQYQVTNLQAALSSFKDFSIADLITVIQRVVELLQNSDLNGLNTKIPVINRTPNEILDVVDGLADAAASLLNGPDLDLVGSVITQLENLATNLGATPSINTKIREQVAKIKAAVNATHVYKLSLTQAPPVAAAADILLEATSGEVFTELTRLFGPNVIDSVTGGAGRTVHSDIQQR